ncbi:MAG: hypothetical protein M3235_01665 [Actinomycetota bacterium]|nr:hypothetical protein [Actinomycetota bacterium]
MRAASTSTATLVGHEPPDVIALAEAIDHEDLRVARFALAMLPGNSESDVVWDLLHEVVPAGRGRLVVCPDRYSAAEETDELGHRVIATVLDPREPGRSPVSGLVRGIHGCFRGHIDEISTRERPDLDPRGVGTPLSAVCGPAPRTAEARPSPSPSRRCQGRPPSESIHCWTAVGLRRPVAFERMFL